MKEIKPVYVRLLVLAIVLYVIGVCIIQTDLQIRVGQLEHTMIHSGEPGHPHAP